MHPLRTCSTRESKKNPTPPIRKSNQLSSAILFLSSLSLSVQILRKSNQLYPLLAVLAYFSISNLEKERKRISGYFLSITEMVGLFSRFSSSRSGHRRTQSAIDGSEVVVPPSLEATFTATDAVTGGGSGFEVATHFTPLEHPSEPLDSDRPIQCPLPEPSILNDGRLWKERVTAGVRRKPDLAVMQEEETLESEVFIPKPRTRANRMILPSISAPEHSILKLLEESGI